jgi:hypothetical protein
MVIFLDKFCHAQFFLYFFDYIIQILVPVEMRRPFIATSCPFYTLCMLPLLITIGASATSGKCIPLVAATAHPVRLTIGLPITFWTAYMNVIHVSIV